MNRQPSTNTPAQVSRSRRDAHALLTGRADIGRNSLGRLPVGITQAPS
jgi:hypothetical protein